jgi:hypothetical protein
MYEVVVFGSRRLHNWSDRNLSQKVSRERLVATTAAVIPHAFGKNHSFK